MAFRTGCIPNTSDDGRRIKPLVQESGTVPRNQKLTLGLTELGPEATSVKNYRCTQAVMTVATVSNNLRPKFSLKCPTRHHTVQSINRQLSRSQSTGHLLGATGAPDEEPALHARLALRPKTFTNTDSDGKNNFCGPALRESLVTRPISNVMSGSAAWLASQRDETGQRDETAPCWR